MMDKEQYCPACGRLLKWNDEYNIKTSDLTFRCKCGYSSKDLTRKRDLEQKHLRWGYSNPDIRHQPDDTDIDETEE